jgi:hypothetical protein
MPNTGRQRYIITATWGAETTAPTSYTKRRLSREGYAGEAESVGAVDLSDAAMVRCKLPATIAASAVTLKFKDAGAVNADSDDAMLDYSYAQDVDGAAIEMTGIQTSKGYSRQVHLDLCSCFYVIPVFVDSGGSPVAPGAVSVEFFVKE